MSVTPPTPTETATRLVVLGYLTAVAVPPIGFLLGVVVAIRFDKPSARHGVWIVVASLIAAVIWVLVLTSGVLTSSSNDLSY
jgi:hypothetical protein